MFPLTIHLEVNITKEETVKKFAWYAVLLFWKPVFINLQLQWMLSCHIHT